MCPIRGRIGDPTAPATEMGQWQPSDKLKSDVRAQLARLSEFREWRIFEYLCCDLLRIHCWPNMRLIGGSRDEGRDLVAYSPEHGHVIGCCTIAGSKDPRGNLNHNLANAKNNGHPCQTAVLATNQQVSSDERKRYESELVSRGLCDRLKVFDVNDIVDLLLEDRRLFLPYRSVFSLLPHWERIDPVASVVQKEWLRAKPTEDALRSYLTGNANISWELVGAGKCVHREQLDTLVHRCSPLEAEARAIVLCGLPGCGKSTLLRHMAAILCLNHDMPLLWVNPDQIAEFWRQLPWLAQEFSGPFVVVVDDLLREQDGGLGLSLESYGFPVTLLTTASTTRSEFVEDHLGMGIKQMPVEVDPPTRKERRQLVALLKRDWSALSDEERRELNAAETMHAAAYAVTKQLALLRHDRAAIRQLSEGRRGAYACLVWSYLVNGITVPESILDKLLGGDQGLWRARLPAGLAFPDERFPGHLRSTRSVCTWDAVQAESGSPAPSELTATLLSVVDSGVVTEARYAAHLMRAVSQRHLEVALCLLRDAEGLRVIQALASASGSISESLCWARMWDKLGAEDERDEQLASAFALQLASEADLLHLWPVARRLGRAEALIRMMGSAPANVRESATGQVVYLRALEEVGDAERTQGGIDQVSRWIADHPNDTAAHMEWAAAVRRHGDLRQVQHALHVLGDQIDEQGKGAPFVDMWRDLVVLRYPADEQTRELLLMRLAEEDSWACWFRILDRHDSGSSLTQCQAAVTEFCDWLGQSGERYAAVVRQPRVLHFIANNGTLRDLTRMVAMTRDWCAGSEQGTLPPKADAGYRNILVTAMQCIRAAGSSEDLADILAVVEQEFRERGADPDLLPAYTALLKRRRVDVEITEERASLITELAIEYVKRFPQATRQIVDLVGLLRLVGRSGLGWDLLGGIR